MTIPKNIFFYWDSNDIPIEAMNNIEYYRDNNIEFNVQLLNNNDINKYYSDFHKLVDLFHLATIGAFKSDIIRMIYLYKEGGIWIDINTTLLRVNGIKILFDRYKNCDFVITLLPNKRNDFKTSALISKPNSKLAYDTINQMTGYLIKHYEIEKQSKEYVPYNYFMFIAPCIFYDLLEYKYDDNFRNNIYNEFIRDKDHNLITLKLRKFSEYKCGLMCVSDLLKFYGCNMSHHHNENHHKHWSEIQKTQKLFFIN